MKRSELFFAFLLLPLDIIMVILAFLAAYVWRVNFDSSLGFFDVGLREYLLYAIYILPIWIILFAINGLYSIRSSTGLLNQFYRIFIASSTAVLALVVLIYGSRSFFFSRFILVSIWVFSIILLSFGRIVLQAIQRSLLKYGIGLRKIILVGDNSTSLEISQYFSNNLFSGYKVVGVVNGNTKDHLTGLKNLGPIENLSMLINKNSADGIVVTDSSISQKTMSKLVQDCYDHKITFKYIPDVFALMSSNFRPALLGSWPVMELKSIPLDGWGRIIKRIGDIIFALLLLILLLPVFLIIAILEKLTSKGPVFYVHNRIGRDSIPFKFYKFRSMYIDKCDFKGVAWTTKEDEKTRITPLGKFLRKTNLDELPQLWNILIGDMSFVGPRPEQPKLAEKFAEEIPDYFKRHKVKTGLTGWAQVNGLKGDTSIKERAEYDIYYIENWSIWFDIKIIIKTIFLIIHEIFNGKSEYRDRP